MNAWYDSEPADWLQVVEVALDEDIGTGDVSVRCIPSEAMVNWHIEAQAEGVVSGIAIAEYLFAPFGMDHDTAWLEIVKKDGERVRRGDILIKGRQNCRRVLSAERTALNFLMHLSGVATHTRRFVDAVGDLPCKVVDTRKTIPGLRGLQKYAVRCGGGANHRMGLYDGVMIKDNHIAAVGSILEAVKTMRGAVGHMVKIEVECETLEQVGEAVQAGADVVLLDNMDPFTMREATKMYKGKTLFEASGGVNLETVQGIAATGVDLVSVGALTHSAPALAMHLEFSS